MMENVVPAKAKEEKKTTLQEEIMATDYKPSAEEWRDLLARAGNDEYLALLIGKSWNYYRERTNGKENTGQQQT